MNNEDYGKALKSIEKGRRERAEKRRRQIRRRITVIIVLLLILLVGGGVAYIKFFGAPWQKEAAGGKKSEKVDTFSDPSGDLGNGETASVSSDSKDSVANSGMTKVDGNSSDNGQINGSGSSTIGIAERLENKDNGASGGNENQSSITDAIVGNDFEIELTFVGDCCMATQLEDASEGTMLWYEENYPPEYFFEKVSQYFENDDLTVANCENAFSDNPGEKRDKGPDGGFWFKSPAKNAKIFKVAGIDAVTLCNNHILDYGEGVLEDTKKALDDAGVTWGYRDKIIYYEKGGFKIAIICSAYYTPDEVWETEDYLEEAKKNSDFQIIYYHGGIEHIYYPEGWMIDANRQLIDEGADLIIGSHPHCLQQIEEYNGVDIVYSLGNFCFGGNSYPQPNRTMIYKYHLKIHKENGKFSITSQERELIPCYIFTGETNNWQPAPITDPEDAYEVTGFVLQEIDLPWPVYGDLYDEDEEETNEESYDDSGNDDESYTE